MSYTPPSITTYTPTLTDVSNTTATTTFVSFVVPANTWADGEVVSARIVALIKNNSGARNSNTLYANVTGGTAQSLGSGGWDNSATEFRRAGLVELMRTGANIAIVRTQYGAYYDLNQAGWVYPTGLVVDTGTVATDTSRVVTPTNFTSDITVSIQIAMGAANATQYIKPQGAMCWKSPVRLG